MSWFGRLFGKKRHVFSDEDRDRSKQVRLERDIVQDRIEFLERRRDRLRAEYKARELEDEIEEMEDELAGDDGTDEDDAPDAMIDSILTKVAPLLAAGSAAQQPNTVQPPQQLHLTDEQLEEYKASIPKPMLKKLRKMSDDELLTLGRQYNPDVFAMADEDTIKRALLILKR